MNANPSAADWASARGEKWSATLTPMEATLSPIDEPLIEALQLGNGEMRIAEIGCGGGATSRELIRRAPAGSVVHGFDISRVLVDQARALANGDGRLRFDVADMSGAAPQAPYDRLVSRFGIMFFDEPSKAFANLARWLKPLGRAAFAVWGPPRDNPWLTSVRDEVAKEIEIPATDQEAPGPFRYADETKLLKTLDQAGFTDVRVADWRGALPIGGALSPTDAATFALEAFSSFAELLANASPGARERVRAALVTSFTRHLSKGAVRLGARVHLVTAVLDARGRSA